MVDVMSPNLDLPCEKVITRMQSPGRQPRLCKVEMSSSSSEVTRLAASLLDATLLRLPYKVLNNSIHRCLVENLTTKAQFTAVTTAYQSRGGWIIDLFFAAFHKGRHEMKSLNEVFQKFHSDPKTKMSGHCVVFN